MKRHETDALSLGAGLLFLVVAVVYGVGEAPSLWVMLPSVLVVLGASGMAAAIVAQRRSESAETDIE